MKDVALDDAAGIARRPADIDDLQSDAHPGDGRGVRLTLTSTGRRTYAGLIRAAAQRDAAFRGCLSRAEHQMFDRALAKLAGRAHAFIQREKVK